MLQFFSGCHRLLHMGTAQIIQGASFRSSGTHFIPVSPYHRDHARLLGWEKFGWRTVGAIIIAIAGLALALDIHGSNLNIEGALLAFSSAVGLAVVVVFSSRVFRNGDARPLTFYMAAAASVFLLGILCCKRGLHTAAHSFGVDGLLNRIIAIRLRDDRLFHCYIADRASAHINSILRRSGDIRRSWGAARRADGNSDNGPRLGPATAPTSL